MFTRPTLPKLLSSQPHVTVLQTVLSLIHIPSTRWPMSLPPFHLAHELLLHYLHPSWTSHMPPTPLLCQLTLENDHIALPFDPWRRTREPRSLAAVLVCHKSLPGTSVIDGPQWAALTHPASARGGVAWGSIDYDAIRDRGESKMSWRWQGKTKETTVMDEVLLVNVMRFDLRSIDHCRNFIHSDL